MTIRPIRTDEDLRAVFHHLGSIYRADEGTPEANEKDVLITLIEAREKQHRGAQQLYQGLRIPYESLLAGT